MRYWKDEWARLIMIEAELSRADAEEIVHLADLNGMFDPYKTLFAVKELLD